MDDKPQSAQRFKVVLEPFEGIETALIIVPFDVYEAFGARGMVRIRGTINGAPFRSSLTKREGRHYMVVNKGVREAAGVSAGDEVDVLMVRDDEPRTIAAPPDLQAALDGNLEALAAWEKLSFSRRKDQVDAIEEAKTEATRGRRVEKTLAMLLERAAKGRK